MKRKARWKIRRIIRKNDKNKDLSHMQSEMGKLTHHDEELLGVWEGWHWNDNSGGWLDPELCAKIRQARGSGVHPSPQDVHKCRQRNVLTWNGKGTHQDRMGGD